MKHTDESNNQSEAKLDRFLRLSCHYSGPKMTLKSLKTQSYRDIDFDMKRLISVYLYRTQGYSGNIGVAEFPTFHGNKMGVTQ